jgi:hypothetical protein
MLLPTEVITVQRIVLPWFFLEGTGDQPGQEMFPGPVFGNLWKF